MSSVFLRCPDDSVLRAEISEKRLGSGGEGYVSQVESMQGGSLHGLDSEDLVVKFYHDPSSGDRHKKIISMIKNPPDSDSLAWPLAAVYKNDNGVKVFAGYVMRRIEGDRFREWADISSTQDRRKVAPDFDFMYALTACRNLLVAVQSVHDSGSCLGDINESNIFVGNDAKILIVDTDSAQVPDGHGGFYPCLVGKPEYTAPEISHGSLRDNPRTDQTDSFACAVAVFQMLTGGSHPAEGAYHGDDDPPSTIERARMGVFPGVQGRVGLFSPVRRIPSECVPSQIIKGLASALSVDPVRRVSCGSLAAVFDEVASRMRKCDRVRGHWFDPVDGECPWCRRRDSGETDPWGPPTSGRRRTGGSSAGQKGLTPLGFKDDEEESPVFVRKPVSPGGSGGSSAGAQGQGGFYPTSPAVNAASSTGSLAQTYPQGGASSGGLPVSQQNGLPQNNASSSSSGSSASGNIPKKIRGKTVLTYTDGSYDVRPSIIRLLKDSPRTALYCVKNETPVLARFWWDRSRPLPDIRFLIPSVMMSLLVPVTWFVLSDFFAGMVLEYLRYDFTYSLTRYLFYTGSVTGLLTVMLLLLSALSEMRSARKQAGTLEHFEKEKPLKTVLKTFVLPVIYGPVFVLVVLVGILLMILNAVLDGFSREAGFSS